MQAVWPNGKAFDYESKDFWVRSPARSILNFLLLLFVLSANHVNRNWKLMGEWEIESWPRITCGLDNVLLGHGLRVRRGLAGTWRSWLRGENPGRGRRGIGSFGGVSAWLDSGKTGIVQHAIQIQNLMMKVWYRGLSFSITVYLNPASP